MTSDNAFATVEHLTSVIDSIPTAIVMVNAEGDIVLVNAQTEMLFGYSRSQLLGEPVELLIPLRYRHHHPDLRGGFYNKATVRPMGSGRDLYGLRRDGTEFPIEIGLNPIRADEKLYVLSAIVDITERKRLEARFRATVENAPTAMLMIDPAGTIVLVNSETTRLFGYEQSELLGKKIEILVPARFAKQHPTLRTHFFANPEGRRMGTGRELFGLRKDESEFPVEIGLNPIATDEGQFVLAAIVDITERQRSLSQLRAANEALESSNIELQQFAYIASHDLQTPLRAISGFAQCLQEDYRDKISATANTYIERIVGASLRMQTLINDLLSFSRVESKAAAFVAVDLNKALKEALLMLGVSDDNPDLIIEKSDLPVVSGDASQLMQLFMNLVGNGIKYCREKPVVIRIDVTADAGSWIISVADNGIGIEPRYFEQVFEIFRRLHNKSEYPGTGIGLALCRRIVSRHHGKIWVESEKDKGSCFYFSIPQKTPIESL